MCDFDDSEAATAAWTAGRLAGDEAMAGSFIGEFEQMVLLAILQLGDHAYAVDVRRELGGAG